MCPNQVRHEKLQVKQLVPLELVLEHELLVC